MKRWNKHTSKTAGFTLLELLIVIAIIGILASIVLFSMNRSRINSRNTAVIQQVQQYQKALQLYFAQNDSYPSGWSTASNRSVIYCIGNGYVAGNQCVPWASTLNPLSQVENFLVPNYINNIVYIPISGSTRGSPGYRGCSDICSALSGCPATTCTTQDYSLFYMLEGISQNCGPGILISGDINSKYTWCQISSSQ